MHAVLNSECPPPWNLGNYKVKTLSTHMAGLLKVWILCKRVKDVPLGKNVPSPHRNVIFISSCTVGFNLLTNCDVQRTSKCSVAMSVHA